MPPEVLAFFNATGRFPQSELELQAASLGTPGNLNPAIGQPGQPFIGQDPFTRPSFAAQAPLGSQIAFQQQSLQPQAQVFQPPGVDPTNLGGVPSPLLNPVQPISSPQLQPLQQSSVPGGGGIDTPDLPTEIARARLGAFAGGPQAGGGAASFGPGNFQGVGGVGIGQGGGAGQGLVSSGLQQQADVAQQRQLAASVLSSLIGGGGAVGGAAIAG